MPAGKTPHDRYEAGHNTPTQKLSSAYESSRLCLRCLRVSVLAVVTVVAVVTVTAILAVIA